MTPAAVKTWTVLDILKWSTAFLQDKGFANPRTDAELLLMAVLNLERIDLYVQFERPLSAAEKAKYRGFILRRVKQEPVQYITGFTYFMGLRLEVNPAVLIPRFDTEILVETVLKKVKENFSGEKLTIIDIGTGSGAIAIALAKYLEAEIIALDNSTAALQLAAQNAEKNQASAKIKFLLSDLLTEIVHHKFEHKTLLVSNPPYVTTADYPSLPAEIKNHEPAKALLGGETGLDCYKKMLGQSAIIGDWLAGIFFEVGQGQSRQVHKLLAERFHSQPNTAKDIGGIERVVYTLL